MKIKKLLAIAVATSLVASAFVGCGSSNSTNGEANSDSTSKSTQEIYFLNFKPEIADVYKKIAKDYEAETGVKVKVETAASGTYEQTLKSEIAKKDAPTIFQINGPVGYKSWKDYCLDLKDTELYNHLLDKNLAVTSGTYEQTLKSEIAKKDAPTIFQINGPVGYKSWKDYCLDLKDTELYNHLLDKNLAVTSGDGVYGIPYAVEGYGIIYNDEIMQKYFALSNKKTDVNSVDEINNFEKLKAVVEDMEANKDALGIQGVFASTSMASGNAWRWETHLANLPLYYEFKDDAGENGDVLQTGIDAKEIDFKYNENYKNI